MSHPEESSPERDPRHASRSPTDNPPPEDEDLLEHEKDRGEPQKSPPRDQAELPEDETPPPAPARRKAKPKAVKQDDLVKTIRKAIKPLSDEIQTMRAHQQRTQDLINFMVSDDGELSPTRRLSFDTPTGQATGTTAAGATANRTGVTSRASQTSRRTEAELDRINRRLDEFNSKVHLVTSSAPELRKILADTRRSPLTQRIRKIRLRDRVRLKIEPFAGDEDPKKWLTAFNLAMTREQYATLEERDANYCQVFVEHMTKEALGWFSNLPTESIDSFDDLTNAFLKHYSMNMTRVTRNMFTITQKKGESLRSFMERFKKAARDLGDMPDSVPLEALRNGLQYESKFKESLSINPSSTLEDALHRSQSYIFLEEDANFYAEQSGDRKPAVTKPKEERREQHQRPEVRRSLSFAVDDTPDWDPEEHPQALALSSSRQPVANLDDDNNHDLFCSFHGRTGHATETCRHLIGSLLRKYREGAIAVEGDRSQGHDFAPKPTKAAPQGKRPRQFRPRKQEKANLAPAPEKRDRDQPNDLPPPPKRQVNMIMGCLLDNDDSISAIKEYERKATAAERRPNGRLDEDTYYYPYVSPEARLISFTDKDAEGLDTPHLDPLVVQMQVHDCDVAKILIDTGSTVNLIFKETLDRMGVEEKAIKPASRPLTGFTAEAVFSTGTIRLSVYVGGISKLVKFTVMDKPAIYNAILGTPWIHEMKAVVSTYHQCVKFPTPLGIFTLRGNQRLSRSCFLRERRLRSSSSCMINEELDPRLPYHRRPKPDLVDQVSIDETRPERCVGIGSNLNAEIRVQLVALLKENVHLFAWSMEDMKGIDPKITSHELNVDPTYKPIKQKRRKLGTDKAQAVNEEVEKLLKAGSITEVKYPDWLANPVVVKKKNGKWRVCVDFTDLNKACPKDSFPLPHIDRLVEATAGNELLSFMDAFSGYNQIFMHPEDREKTAFITDRGTYCYKVMPFGLKNAGATYQRLVNKMFADQLGNSMEVYIDDMLVKSAKAQDHVKNLQECFSVLTKYGMKLNPAKCSFAVTSGEFLGYIVTQRGIEANPKQISAILDLPSPKTAKEVQRLTGRIAALNRFISRSTDKCLPFYQLLRSNKHFQWDERCEDAFNQLKQYLTTPPVLAKPEEGETLFLYIAISSTAVSGVLIREDRGEQRPIFYVSKTLNDSETRYPTLEKLALAVVISARKLRPYFQSHAIIVLSSQPLRQILHGPNQSGRMARWAVELSEYDIEFKGRTSAKSQVLADFIVEIPPELVIVEAEHAPKWLLHVDGASSKQGSGVGIRLVSPTGEILEQSFKLNFPASNNEAEYEAIIAGLRLAKEVGAEHVHAFCDSQLVAKQFSGDYDAKDDRMDAYLKMTIELSKQFKSFELTKIPRAENAEADALAALASRTDSALRRTIPVEAIEQPSIKLSKGAFVMAISQEDEEDEDDEAAIPEAEDQPRPWQDEIKDYLVNGTVPENRWAARRLRRKAAYYFLENGELFRWTANKVVLRCCDEAQAKRVMIETHEGPGGNHAGGKSLASKIKKHGLFWPRMLEDCENHTAKCVSCQRYAPIINAPTQELQASVPAYPFMRWGMDIVGPMPRSRQCAYLLIVTDYFTKWVEAKAFANPTAKDVQNFVWQYIICRHGLPYEIVTDNGGQFVAASFRGFCASWKIKLVYSTPRYPQANGQAEATNKTIVDGLKKRLKGYQGAWVDELDGVLWSHRTTPRSASGETPFSLSHGCEALAPAEMHVASLRRSLMPLNSSLNDDALHDALTHAEELRDRALLRMQNYQQKAARYYAKKVRNRRFALHDLVLKKVYDFTKPEHAGKFGSNWEGPYRITRIVKPGVYQLEDDEGSILPRSWNSMNLRKFHH